MADEQKSTAEPKGTLDELELWQRGYQEDIPKQPRRVRYSADGTEFPYEYGSDLHCLWGWGHRLDTYLASDQRPSRFSPMIFRPDRRSADAMMRYSREFPHVIEQIKRALAFADERFATFLDDSSEANSDDFAGEMFHLRERVQAGVAVIAEQEQADAGSDDPQDVDTEDGLTWPIALERLQQIRLQGRPFTSLRKLGEQIRCSHNTVGKAIRNSEELTAWKNIEKDRKPAPRAVRLNKAIQDDTEQRTEGDHTDILEEQDVERVMVYLINQADEIHRDDTKAEIAKMTPDARRGLASMTLENPDHFAVIYPRV